MPNTCLYILLCCLLVILFSHPGSALNSESLIQLKKAGVSDQTIQLIVKEKVVETAALSVREILDMKKAGLSEETIQIVIKEGSFLRDRGPIVYGKDIRSVRFSTAKDIIDMKKAGVSDEVIKAILYVVGESYHSERQEALRFLREMGILIDLRTDD